MTLTLLHLKCPPPHLYSHRSLKTAAFINGRTLHTAEIAPREPHVPVVIVNLLLSRFLRKKINTNFSQLCIKEAFCLPTVCSSPFEFHSLHPIPLKGDARKYVYIEPQRHFTTKKIITLTRFQQIYFCLKCLDIKH